MYNFFRFRGRLTWVAPTKWYYWCWWLVEGSVSLFFRILKRNFTKAFDWQSSTLIPNKLLLIPKIIFGTVVGLLFFNITFGWPDKHNKFFYPDYVEFMWPMLLATVACFVFGAWATKDTRRKGFKRRLVRIFLNPNFEGFLCFTEKDDSLKIS